MNTILIALSVTTLFGIVYFIKYLKVVKTTKKIYSELQKPIRHGYYKQQLSISDKITGAVEHTFETIIHVKELDRYTDGTSKIEIEKIEPGISNDKCNSSRVSDFINETFKSITNTNRITWLESENEIKEIRKNKLSQLKKIFK